MIEDDEINAVTETLKSGWLTKGPKTIQFEKKIANYIGSKHAIALNSCTAALHLSLFAAAICGCHKSRKNRSKCTLYTDPHASIL
jgi:dTDP-4-amino-4,6-dideoxygalactose transaminase